MPQPPESVRLINQRRKHECVERMEDTPQLRVRWLSGAFLKPLGERHTQGFHLNLTRRPFCIAPLERLPDLLQLCPDEFFWRSRVLLRNGKTGIANEIIPLGHDLAPDSPDPQRIVKVADFIPCTWNAPIYLARIQCAPPAKLHEESGKAQAPAAIKMGKHLATAAQGLVLVQIVRSGHGLSENVLMPLSELFTCCVQTRNESNPSLPVDPFLKLRVNATSRPLRNDIAPLLERFQTCSQALNVFHLLDNTLKGDRPLSGTFLPRKRKVHADVLNRIWPRQVTQLWESQEDLHLICGREPGIQVVELDETFGRSGRRARRGYRTRQPFVMAFRF